MNTDFLTHLNWLSILAGAVGYFLLGGLWYSVLFGKKWIEYTGAKTMDNDPDAKKGVGAIMFISFILMFICTIGIAILMEKGMIVGWMGAVKLGLLTGVCFCMTSISISMVYEKKPFGLHLINGFYNILGNVIAALIVVCWPW